MDKAIKNTYWPHRDILPPSPEGKAGRWVRYRSGYLLFVEDAPVTRRAYDEIWREAAAHGA